MIMISLTILFTLIGYYLSIHAPITCIIYDLTVLGLVQKIQVMGSLQDDKLFTVNS